MRKLFLSLVFLSVLLSIHANPGIKGIVIDQTTRKALDYAHVVLYDRDHIVEEAMTEANGSFLIQPVKPGTYSIRIHFLGYDVYWERSLSLQSRSRIWVLSRCKCLR